MPTYSLAGEGNTNQVSPLSVNLQEAKQLVIERARELVNRLVERRGGEEPPFLAEEFAPLQGVKKIVKADLGEQSALLLRLSDGYIIKVNAKHSQVRQNFSCAHEIGHTFLHELEQKARTGSAEFRMAVAQVSEQAKERLCDAAAAELLMPESIFKEYLSHFKLSVNAIERLAYTFRVSIPAAAIRVAEVSVAPCLAIKWNRWQRSRSKGFLRDWTKEPARRTYVRDPSALLKAYESNDTVKSFKSFEIGNVRKRCLMESKGFGHDKTRYVLSLVFPDR